MSSRDRSVKGQILEYVNFVQEASNNRAKMFDVTKSPRSIEAVGAALIHAIAYIGNIKTAVFDGQVLVLGGESGIFVGLGHYFHFQDGKDCLVVTVNS